MSFSKFAFKSAIFNHIELYGQCANINIKRYSYFMQTIKNSFLLLNIPSRFQKIIKKNTQMYTLYTNLLFYITFTIFYYIGQG